MRVVIALTLTSLLWGSPTPAASQADGPKGATPVSNDTCGAVKMQWLVGQPRSAVPVTPAGETWRIYSTDQVVTMDYVATRLDIVWDARTGKVVKVKCG